MSTENQDLSVSEPSNTLQYYLQARNGKKRNYIYNYSKSRTCDHPSMKVVARGGIVYRCEECNYSFHITSAYQQPLHNEVLQAAFTMLGFAKEFGGDSLGEVLRRPIGQADGSPHKPVLPEGMSFTDVLAALEEIDVNSADGGAAQLSGMLESLWEKRIPALPESKNGSELGTSGSDGSEGDASGRD